ncbi:MAG: DNA cytosine methyltransferase [Alcanivoracaceae bacterium]|nr:DNA cytosine methyltransferase [Alcanivoracaceae bacterium]
MAKKKKFTFVDLFAGCGGLSLGLEQAGFTPLFVNELSPDAMGTYLLNRDDHYPWLRKKYNKNDIKDLTVKPGTLEGLKSDFKTDFLINDIDLVAGGPPCQGYSGIGHRRSYAVDKAQLPSNHLYQHYARVINVLRPKIFLFENVRGLLNAKWTDSKGESGEIWRDVLATLKNIPGYTVNWQLVYAKDYGVPQNRPRVLAVGIRNDLGIKEVTGRVANGFLPETTGGYPSIPELLSDLVDPDYTPGGETTKYPSPAKNHWQKQLRLDPETGKVRGKNTQLTEHVYSNHSQKIIDKFSHMLANDGVIPDSMKTKKFAQRVLPETWDERGPTITATSLPDDYVHYCQPRSPTVREWARIQMFPDWYEFAGKRTTGGIRRAGNPQAGIFDREVPKYTQIGNAVPVKLAHEIGKHFIKMIS